MFGWRVPEANEALLISGGKKITAEGTQFRVVVGRGAFVLPGFRKAGFLSLQVTEADIEEECITQQGIKLGVQGVVVFKVGDDVPSIAASARRFLDQEDQMEQMVGQVFGGHLRSVVGGMTVEDIIQNRAILAQQVRDSTANEIERMGLVVDSFQIKEIEDPSGYVEAMSQPHVAEVQKKARIAKATANQDAEKQEQESAAQVAGYTRDSEIAQANATAATQEAKATADQAGPLAQAQAQQAVVDEQTKLAKKEAERTEATLVSSVQKPADADAYKTRVTAEAEAHANEVRAKALDGGNLDRIVATQVVQVLPELVKAAAEGIANSNLTVFNGADGITDILTKLVGQALPIYRNLTAEVSRSATEAAADAAGKDEGVTLPPPPEKA